ncbi:IclR family transcriptional regulator C-terminal domain-containing protein, partial [Aestuariivirga sp.]|uniref:IclR family transcriptional regulator n=1 Tax=Aestuariivirga sp. TaxID=2650926 RepID=UPI00301786DC
LVTLAQVESREITRAISPPGGRVAATCSAMGKALIATWTDEQIAMFCKQNGFRKLTPNSHRTLASLMADIRTIRKRGFAIDDEEHVAGLRCVAAVASSPQGDAICALSVSGLANRLSAARASAVAGRVVVAAREFAQKIGPR